MSISLYSSSTVDSLLSPKLSISSLSNAATATLNATAPTTGQVLTYDGTELIWATGGGGGAYLPLTGGTLTGEIFVDESSTSGFATYYNGAGMFSSDGSKMISQEEVIISGYNFTAPVGGYVSADTITAGAINVTVGGITFADSTTQSTASVPFNGGTVGSPILVAGSGGTVSISDTGIDLSASTAGGGVVVGTSGISFSDSTIQTTAAGAAYTADNAKADAVSVRINYFPYYNSNVQFDFSTSPPLFVSALGASWGIFEAATSTYFPVAYVSFNNAYFMGYWGGTGPFYVQVNGTNSSFSF